MKGGELPEHAETQGVSLKGKESANWLLAPTERALWHNLVAQSAVPQSEGWRKRERPGQRKGMIRGEEKKKECQKHSNMMKHWFQERLTSAYEFRPVFEDQLTGATFEALK